MPQQPITTRSAANTPADVQAIIGSWLRLSGCDAFTATAMSLTVGGWALIWACGLSIIEFVPLPLAVIAFFLGLIMIPFRAAAWQKPDL